MSRRAVGILAYDFSTRIMGGSIRIIAFAKALADNGHPVYVFTASAKPEWPDIEGVAIHFASSLEKRASGGLHSSGADSVLRKPRGFARFAKMLQHVVPVERQWIWCKQSFTNAYKFFSDASIDTLLSTSSPYEVLKFGNALASRLRIPHIADIRDDWEDRNRIDSISQFAKRARSRSLMREVKNAHEVVVVSPVTQRRFRDEMEVDTSLILNGYCESDFRNVPTSAQTIVRGESLLIRHLGWLGSFRSMRPILDALEILSRESPGIVEDIRFEQIGLVEETEISLVEGSGHKRQFVFRPQVSHKTYLDLLQTSDVLLCIPGNNIPAAISGKLFEYYRARRPVLLLAEPGSAAHSLGEKIGLRWMAAPTDAFGIAQCFREMHQQKRTGSLRTNSTEDCLSDYSRESGAQMLCDIVARISGTKLDECKHEPQIS